MFKKYVKTYLEGQPVWSELSDTNAVNAINYSIFTENAYRDQDMNESLEFIINGIVYGIPAQQYPYPDSPSNI